MADLSGKTAVITGGSRGIGRAIVDEFLKAGAYVIFTYNNSEEQSNEIVKNYKEKGFFLEAHKVNLNDYNNILRFYDDVISRRGSIDILVNNAGISKVGLFMDMTKDDIDEIVETNFTGTIYLTQFIVKKMVMQKKGCILNISSIWGNTGASCESVYSATKGGITMFTKSLAKELGSCNIRVNALAPGVIKTEMNEWMNDEEKRELCDEIPLNRFGEKDEGAKCASFLCSDDASYVSGQVLTVDGAML